MGAERLRARAHVSGNTRRRRRSRLPSSPRGAAVRFLASRKWRLFIILWVVYSVHFATNVVREHYPAFSLVDHGTFRVDEYQGFNSDIFVHNGHSVIGNQVFVSMLAAVPLWGFHPVLGALERVCPGKVPPEGGKDARHPV